jgi:hypothetical protein
VVLCPDVAPYSDSRFDCRDLLQRSVIHYGAERKASSAIISTPIQGVTTGTVASISRGPSEDRSSGLVSIQAEAFIFAASVGGLWGVTKIRDPSRAGHVVCRTDFWFSP